MGSKCDRSAALYETYPVSRARNARWRSPRHIGGNVSLSLWIVHNSYVCSLALASLSVISNFVKLHFLVQFVDFSSLIGSERCHPLSDWP